MKTLEQRKEEAWAAYFRAVAREEKARRATARAQWKAEDLSRKLELRNGIRATAEAMRP